MDRESDPGLRALVAADVPDALAISFDAGWNQTGADWLRLLRLEPEACLGIWSGGRLAATTTLLCHGRELAWLGMVLTERNHQRRGYARHLCEAVLRLACERGIECVKLDATDQGRPLYLNLGFIDECPIERWRRDPRPAVKTAPPPPPYDPVLDRQAFGADRSRFLETLQFAADRPGARARYLGPLVARDAHEAESVIARIVGSDGGPWFWDLFPDHSYAPRIAERLGFSPVRRLTRMVRGRNVQWDRRLVYASGGFEAG